MSTAPVLTVSNVSVCDPARHLPLVDRVSFSLGPGERCALIGASGAGKSLLATALLRVLPLPLVAFGEVRVSGVELMTLSASALRLQRGRSLLLLPQSAGAALSPAISLLHQVQRAAARRSSDGIDARAQDALREAQLPQSAWRLYPAELSGGMRQRALVALAFALQPHVLIADEPSTGLDPITQQEVFASIDRLVHRTGCALLLITHDLRAAGVLCRDGLLIDRGRMVWQGKLQELAGPEAPSPATQLTSAARQLSS